MPDASSWVHPSRHGRLFPRRNRQAIPSFCPESNHWRPHRPASHHHPLHHTDETSILSRYRHHWSLTYHVPKKLTGSLPHGAARSTSQCAGKYHHLSPVSARQNKFPPARSGGQKLLLPLMRPLSFPLPSALQSPSSQDAPTEMPPARHEPAPAWADGQIALHKAATMGKPMQTVCTPANASKTMPALHDHVRIPFSWCHNHAKLTGTESHHWPANPPWSANHSRWPALARSMSLPWWMNNLPNAVHTVRVPFEHFSTLHLSCL